MRTRQDLLWGRAGIAGAGPVLVIATPERAYRSDATNRCCQIMPSRRNKKWVIPSAFKGISPFTRHYSKLGTMLFFTLSRSRLPEKWRLILIQQASLYSGR